MSTKKIARRWGPPLFLGLVSIGAWFAAQEVDTDNASTEAVVFENELQTQMLSPRRMPRTLQVPIVDRKLGEKLQPIHEGLPATSCVVVEVDGRVVEPTLRAELGLIPASNMKVITTWAALTRLGPDFRFRTEVRADTPPDEEGVIQGNLYLVGDGDPFLSTSQWWDQYESVDGRHHTSLEQLADAVVDAGVVQVTGVVVGDESAFDQVRQGEWADRLIAGQQSGPLSALTVNEGFVDWPEVHVTPRDRSATTAPARHAAGALAALLAERGVTVGAADAGVASATSVEIGAIESPPLSDLVTHINSYSSNMGAELLVKKLGQVVKREGSTMAGTEVVVETLAENGVETAGLIINDGSGLAESSRITCEALVAVLVDMGPASPLGQSMAIAGQRGTLKNLFLETPAEGNVYAKTGTLNDAISLSGYVHSEDTADVWIAFAYIANDTFIIGNDELDQRLPLVTALARYPSSPQVASLLPAEPAPVG